jgi:acyl-CoA synthetase (AMP-forming)/AMP-acid ligase II
MEPDIASLSELLELRARSSPRETAFVFWGGARDVSVTYEELWTSSAAIAAGLRRRGIGAGCRVGIGLDTGLPLLASIFGAMMTGAAAAVLPIGRGHAEGARLRSVLRTLQPALVLSIAGLQPEDSPAPWTTPEVIATSSSGSCPGPLDPSAPAYIQLTSGSTTQPKAAVISHGAALANLRAIHRALQIAPGDVLVSWLPLFHDMGLVGCSLMPIFAGGVAHLASPFSFVREPLSWLQRLSRHHATVTVAPPSAYAMCTRQAGRAGALDLSALRLALVGAEPVVPEWLRAFQSAFGASGARPEALTPVYGLAENTLAVAVPPLARPFLSSDRSSDRRTELASVGSSVMGTELDVLGGRIRIRGTSLFSGYLDDQGAVIPPTVDADGWFDTGDLGYLEGGELFVEGRASDVIIRGGRNIHPQPIELAAAGVRGVRQGCVAAVGAFNPALGTQDVVVVAETRLSDSFERERIAREIRRRVLEIGEQVHRVVVVDAGAVPRTTSGKIRRQECARQFARPVAS